jgi:NitT/TauT family transport system ATP-binding protein
VLVARHDWVEDNPGVVRALMRAVWRAARRPSTLAARITASELLSRPECLDLPAAHTDRALTRRLAIDASGEGRSPPGFSRILRHSGAFFAALSGDLAGVAAAAQACFRTDLCRANLGPIGADPLGAS